ncbi:MAG: 30S ribosomal protein S18 [Minisyncoccales bacterium]|jgi:small subunit ribosomal protein S18
MECYFCKNNIKEIDFKNTELLNRFISGLMKIKPRKKTGVCSHHQRRLSQAIKRARNLGLIASTPK